MDCQLDSLPKFLGRSRFKNLWRWTRASNQRKTSKVLHRGKPKFSSYIYRKINLHSADISVKRTQTPTCSERALLASKSSAQTPLIMFSDVVLKQRRLFQIDALTECSYLALINRAGGLYGRILTEVVSTDRTQWGLYTRPRSRFSHTDRLSSVNKMFIIWQTQEKFNLFHVIGLY